MKKTLILIRHAHRDNTQRNLDNGLSEKGIKQAARLQRFAGQRFKRADWVGQSQLLSSPKKRCLETLAPLSKTLDLPIATRPELDEQKSSESYQAFSDRITKFLDSWIKERLAYTVVCSHGDWLPLAILHLLGSAVELKKGSWLELDWEMGRAHLRWYVPTLKYFYED